VIDQAPKPSTRAPAGQAIRLTVSSGPARNAAAPVASKQGTAPVSETFELANVTNRNIEDAGIALAEFKLIRVETASALPKGQVIEQTPAAGNMVKPGSAVTLQISDGSLATPASASTPPVAAPTSTAPTSAVPTSTASVATTPVATAPAATTPAATAPAAATLDTTPPVATTPLAPVPPTANAEAPVQTSATEPTTPSFRDFVPLAVAALLAIALAALLLARRDRGRTEAVNVEPTFSPPTQSCVAVPIEQEIRFAARLEAGDARIEFTATSDADADLDNGLYAAEETIEHWGDRHG